MQVELLKDKEHIPWLLKKHYARVLPPVTYCFGLIIESNIEGVCTFGIPASRFKFTKQPYELNRLVVNEGLEKNTLSRFVSTCLNQFPESSIIVSYADQNQGHHGYIYQATNWIYTGMSSKEKKMFLDNKQIHRKTLYNKYNTSSIDKLKELGLDISYEIQEGKYRYFQFTGNKKEKRNFKKEVLTKYNELPYPKGNNINYECSFNPEQKYSTSRYKLFF